MRATHLFRDDDELPSDRFDIQSLEKNKAYVQQMSADVAAGIRSFYQGMRIGVPDMEKAVTFWTKGCGALVLDTKLVNGVNVTRIGFGPQSFRRDDGAKFALEMVEGPSTRCEPQPLDRRAFRAEQLSHPHMPACIAFTPRSPCPRSFETGGVLQYVQLAIPIFRLSQVMKNGGDIQSSYGWTQLTAPGGLPLRVHIDESRRDPFEFVALRTSSLKSSVAHYESLGLRKVDEKSGRKVELSINKNTIFENSDAYEPDREVGSILMSYGDKKAETGVLLLPPLKGAKLIAGSNGAAADPMPPVMSFVGAPDLVERPGPDLGPDGVLSVFTPIEDAV